MGILSPFRGSSVISVTHGLRRGLHSFAAPRLTPDDFPRPRRRKMTNQSGLSRFEVTTQSRLDSLAQGGRAFVQNVTQGAKEIRKLLFRPIQHVLREKPPARAEFLQRNAVPAIPALATSPRTAAPAGVRTPRARRSMCRSRRLCQTARHCANSSQVRDRTDTSPCSARRESGRVPGSPARSFARSRLTVPSAADRRDLAACG